MFIQSAHVCRIDNGYDFDLEGVPLWQLIVGKTQIKLFLANKRDHGDLQTYFDRLNRLTCLRGIFLERRCLMQMKTTTNLPKIDQCGDGQLDNDLLLLYKWRLNFLKGEHIESPSLSDDCCLRRYRTKEMKVEVYPGFSEREDLGRILKPSDTIEDLLKKLGDYYTWLDQVRYELLDNPTLEIKPYLP